ncbi:hypothetical protein J7L97_02525 [Candidatus Bathyarchaeota archaeon]|nr:hypothetical protein [Candidatus Bathyarchaeota archaeon]
MNRRIMKKKGRDLSNRFQHIYRCPRCYIKLTYWPTEENPCTFCGYPKYSRDEYEIMQMAEHFRELARGMTQ